MAVTPENAFAVLLVMSGYGVAFVLGMVVGWWLRGRGDDSEPDL